MIVAFSKQRAKRSCTWEAVIGKRTKVPGSTMGPCRSIPHDLAQYVVEAANDYEAGFWGSVAKGATFKSTGRKRTKPGRAVIARNRASIIASEHLANHHLAEWYCGVRTDTAHALDRAFAQWRRLREGERLVFTWPSATGTITSA